MKYKSSWAVLTGLLVFFGLVLILTGKFPFSAIGAAPGGLSVGKRQILHLPLHGVIMDGRQFIEELETAAKNPRIAAIVIDIESPGGVVGPSQMLYSEIRRIRKEVGKPIVGVSQGLIASGAYYVAMGMDQLIVAPGALVGSIGVIMSFTNAEGLFDFIKVKPYTITTGKYKDSGAPYRSMREDERQIFQELIDSAYGQFVKAVIEGRKLGREKVLPYADGRIMTGEQALGVGFVDKTGSLQDAFNLAGELAGVKNFEVIKPSPKGFWEQFFSQDREGVVKWFFRGVLESFFPGFSKQQVLLEMSGRPLYLAPGVL
jgi:protease-4